MKLYFLSFLQEVVSRSRKSSENRRMVIVSVLVGLILVLAIPGMAAAVEREQAIAFAREGRCEVALEGLLPIHQAAAKDALVEQLTGECALRLQRFRLAEEAFKNARALDPQTPKVDLHLAIAHFHQGEVDEASEALEQAAKRDAQAPEFLLYSGLVAIELAEFDLATRNLRAASQLEDRSPEPMASYFLGQALTETERLDEAEVAFDQVIANFPGSAWADQAQAAKEAARKKKGFDVQYWGTAEVGFEHDDNVLLRGQDVFVPPEPDGGQVSSGDQRGFWFLDAGALVDLSKVWRLGGMLRYSGTDHLDQFEFDAHSPGTTIWLDRILTKQGAALRLQYELDGTWVDNDPFVVSHQATAAYYQPWDQFGHTTLSGSFGHSQYYFPRFQVPDAAPGAVDGDPCPGGERRCGPFGLNERTRLDRTGDGLTLSLRHQLPIDFQSSVVNGLFVAGGYRYHRYWARGAEYDRHRHQVELEIGGTLPFDVSMTFGGRFAYDLYDNNSIFPDGPASGVELLNAFTLPSRRRREQETRLWVRLEKAITEQVALTAHYRRTRNRSNTEVFDYERNVVGFSLRVALGG